MTLTDALARLAARFPGKTSNDEFNKLATPILNDAYLDVGKSWDWTELLTYGSIVAVPVVTGTVAITSGSNTVAIGAADSTWKGRFFRKQGGNNDYRIVNVNGSVLTLDQAIVEDSGSITYEVENRFYTLPTECREIVSFENRAFLTSIDNNALRQHVPGYSSRIVDNPFVVSGTDKFTDDYTAGTISAVVDSNVITGDGTQNQAWLANARAGNIININNVDYRIRRVETDTRIITYNKVPLLSLLTAYTIKQDAAKTVRMRGIFTAKAVVPFMYVRSVYPMIHNQDTIDLGEEAKLAVLDFAEASIAAGPLKQDDWPTRLVRAQARLERAQALSAPVRPAFRQFPPLIPSGMGRGARRY